MEQLTWESLKGKYLQPEARFSIHMTTADLQIIQEAAGGWKALEETLAEQHKRIWLTDAERYFPMTLVDVCIVNGRMFGDPYKGFWKASEQEMVCAMEYHGDHAAVMKLAAEHNVFFYIWNAGSPGPENGLVSLKIIKDLRDRAFEMNSEPLYVAMPERLDLFDPILHHDLRNVVVIGVGPGSDSWIRREPGKFLLDESIRLSVDHLLTRSMEEVFTPRNRSERRSKRPVSESKYKRGEWWNR